MKIDTRKKPDRSPRLPRFERPQFSFSVERHVEGKFDARLVVKADTAMAAACRLAERHQDWGRLVLDGDGRWKTDEAVYVVQGVGG